MAISDDFEFAFDRIKMGVGRKTLMLSAKDKEVTAFHEGGHALTAFLNKDAHPVHKVTILPRGNALGYVEIYFKSII